MEKNNNHNLEIVQNVIKEFYLEFLNKPFDYLYEADIHTELSYMLKRDLGKIYIKTIDEDFEINKPFNFSIVRNEYKKKELGYSFFDIVILEEDIKLYKDNHQRKEDKNEMFLYWQKINIAIELKLHQIHTNQDLNFMSDINRLELFMDTKAKEENRINTGIALLFYQRSSDFSERKKILKELNDIKPIVVTPENINKIVLNPNTINTIVLLPSDKE